MVEGRGNLGSDHGHARSSKGGAKPIGIGHHESILEAGTELSSALLLADTIFEVLVGEGWPCNVYLL